MGTIIVCDAIHPIGFELLKKERDIEIIDATELSKDELLKLLPKADVAITRSPTAVNDKFLNSGVNLKAIVRAGVGVDNVDIESCSKRGIIIMNVPTANTIAAVEMTMAHLINSARSYVNSCNDLKINRIWKREKWYGNELFGKKLGVIGFGNIGSRVATRALAFGMDVVAYDPYISPSKATSVGVKYCEDFGEILSSDFITIHTPKTKETIDMISFDEMKKLKDGVRLINCARGGLFNEDALVEGLKSGKIAYLGIDVFDKEPATDHPFLDFENVSATPHLGANTKESQKNIATQAVEQAISALRGICYPNALNLPIKEEDIPKDIEPYIELISKMSYLGAQINKAPIKSIELQASGEVANYLDSMITFALVSALRDTLGDNINYVNAKFIAEEKKIALNTSVITQSSYKNRVTVKIVTDKDISSVSGTVFAENEGRIININGFKTDFKPKGKMIVFKNEDIPGVIRDISTILAKEQINIADFRLGRSNSGDGALAVILVDEDITKETLAALNKIPACIWAKYAVL